MIFIYFSNKAVKFICTILVLQASSSSDEDVPMTICKLCKEEFPDMARRLSHFIKCKSEMKCNLCQMPCSYFRTVKNFKSHMKICNDVNNYWCSHCKKGFQKMGNCHMHMYQCSQRIKCKICCCEFGNENEHWKHVVKKHRCFSCNQCNFTMITEGILRTHMYKNH